MRTIIAPFTENHLEAAAALLAVRHCHDRRWTPALAPAYEDITACLHVLQELLASDGASGVVALRGGRLVGYLVGTPELGSPTRTFAGFMHPRAAEIAYAGHAVDPDDGNDLYPPLYAGLAQEWTIRGLVGHYITVPVTPETAESWSDLGFGRFLAFGTRSTAPGDAPRTPELRGLQFRLATAADEAAIQVAMTEFFRTFADSPIFVPFLPETTADRRRFVAEHLTDPACHYWLACDDDRVAGLHLFVEPTSAHWGQSPLESPERSVYLHIAYTMADARSTGVGAALLDHTMTWAHEAGYDICTAHWVTMSRAARFWRGQGFRPVSFWLRRVVDERATWADGRD